MNKKLTAHEKRIHQRRVLRTRVIFEDESGEGFVYFYSTDVSVGGIFFESDIPLKIGTMVFISFTLGSASIRSVGRIARVERDVSQAAPVVGMGIQFVDLPEKERQLIEAYVG